MNNVFLITIDALRADRLKHINTNKGVTSFLDSFAKDNITFTNASSTGPSTPLSFPAILTGLYASEFYDSKGHQKTIANVFQENGYKTSAFNSNPHFRLWGLNKGLDFFEDFLDHTQSERDSPMQKIKKRVTKTFGQNGFVVKTMSKILKLTSSSIPKLYADAETLNNTTLSWLEKNKDKRNFCWMHYMEPHYPYMPPEKYINGISKNQITKLNRAQWIAEHEGISKVSSEEIEKIIKLYDGEVRYVDEYVGHFIKGLKELGLYKDSTIVITADHGEMLGEHGRFGHNRDVLYKDQIHVPLIIKTIKNNKKTIAKPVSLIDLPYNLTMLTGVDSSFFKGVSFIDRKYVISESFKRSSLDPQLKKVDKSEMLVSCQKNNYKLIIDDINNKKELFKLDVDAEEKNNLFDMDNDIVKDLLKQINAHKTQKNEKILLSSKIKSLKESGKI